MEMCKCEWTWCPVHVHVGIYSCFQKILQYILSLMLLLVCLFLFWQFREKGTVLRFKKKSFLGSCTNRNNWTINITSTFLKYHPIRKSYKTFVMGNYHHIEFSPSIIWDIIQLEPFLFNMHSWCFHNI